MERAGRVEDMIVFARVFETRSLTRAAKGLGSTRSAISKSIARLEHRLGTRLLQRTTRQLSPTAAGHACYVHCARIAAEVVAAERTASELRATPRGPLRVTCGLALGMLLAPAFPAFAAKYPNVSLEVQLTESVVDLVGAGVDVGVRLGEMASSSLVGRKLASYRRVLVASPAYLAERGAPRTIEDVARHACMVRAGVDQWTFTRGKRSVSVAIDARFRADTPELLRQGALAGMGLAIVPSFLVKSDLDAGHLVTLLEAHEPAAMAIYAVYPHQKHLAPSARAFVDFLVEAVARVV